MVTPSTPEASEIRRRGRQRLIGAIAIAVLLVVFVPMMLDSEPKRARNEPALEIPAKENAPPLPPPVGAKAQPAPPAEAPKAAPAAAKPPAPKLEGFAVQVGAFKDEDKLKQARDKLTAAGIPHFVERRDMPGGTLNRLRAGPYSTREAAEKALAAVKGAALEGQVVPLP